MSFCTDKLNTNELSNYTDNQYVFSQNNPHISLQSMFHRLVHDSPLLVAIFSRICPVQTLRPMSFRFVLTFSSYLGHFFHIIPLLQVSNTKILFRDYFTRFALYYITFHHTSAMLVHSHSNTKTFREVNNFYYSPNIFRQNLTVIRTLPSKFYLPDTTFQTLPSRHYLPNSTFQTLPSKLYLPDTTFQILPSRHYLPNSTYQTLPSKFYLPDTTFQTLPSKLYLPDTTFQILPSRHYFPNSTFQTLPTRHYLPNSTFQTLPSKLYLPDTTLQIPTVT